MSERQRGNTSGRCRSCTNKNRTYMGLKKPWKSGVIADWTKKNIRQTKKLTQSEYMNLHNWVKSKLGKPYNCENCGIKDAKKFEWANKSGDYKKELSDWIRLCTSCHRKFDTGVLFVGKEG